MPLALLALAIRASGIGSTEFMSMRLPPQVGASLGVPMASTANIGASNLGNALAT
ncbi:hypothetical protein GCM10011581_30990 [Saccharopolyspora subtropica]|uniref:MFS transporter n=2 Tax=Saccharopolyspora thermophila TaxID=89367 RepID=A0A917NE22_9PSEU|nr:hypothetical protein GCM10011581_30990 [Saccharopolyspora subtropica]